MLIFRGVLTSLRPAEELSMSQEIQDPAQGDICFFFQTVGASFVVVKLLQNPATTLFQDVICGGHHPAKQNPRVLEDPFDTSFLLYLESLG